MDIDDACCTTRNTENMIQFLVHLTGDFHQLKDVNYCLSVSGNDYNDDGKLKNMEKIAPRGQIPFECASVLFGAFTGVTARDAISYHS